MISVEEALQRLLSLVTPLEAEPVPLAQAGGRALAEPIVARRDAPPFRTAMMDGYAVRSAPPGRSLRVIGEAAAGRGFDGRLDEGEAVRIFTGARVPEGAERILIQEDADRSGDQVTPKPEADETPFIRPAGADYRAGARIEGGQVLRPALVALAASFGAAAPLCRPRPDVAILSTGDELVPPGAESGPDGITASNGVGLAALVATLGGRPRILPIARDDADHLAAAIHLARDADLLVTSGGASVGDHDLVAPTLRAAGATIDFHKVAMRPGKPLFAGRMGQTAILGLPGNPVSAMVCGRLFMRPMIRAMLGLPAAEEVTTLSLAASLPPNGSRQHYMRAAREGGLVRALDTQDSGRLTPLAEADTLIVRPPHDPARRAGDPVECLPLDL